MAKTTEQLLLQAVQIRDEQANKKNTALRVGTLFSDIIQKQDEDVTALDKSVKDNKEKLTELVEKIPNTNFITCSTLNSVANKTVNILGFRLSNRVRLLVKMTNANTADNANLSISSPQLDTKPLYYNGERASSKNSWEAGAVLDVYYDGTNFQATDFQGGASITVDSELSDTSTNPVQNKAIAEKLAELGNKTSGVGYVVCTEPAANAAKRITVDGLTALTTGIRLLVKMVYNNTASGVSLNINSLGAKPLYYNNVRVSGDNAWAAGEVIEVYYDGTNFYSSNVLGGTGGGGNMILEWDTDVATTRKQVKTKDRKEGLQISYKNDDGVWINEQFIGTAVTDANWANDVYWKKLCNQDDLDSLPYIPSSTGYSNTVKDAFSGKLMALQRNNNLLHFISAYRNISFIQIKGTSGADGTLIISYNSQEYRFSITNGEDENTIASKVTGIDGATIYVYNNLIKLECETGGVNPKMTAIFESSITGLSIISTNQYNVGSLAYISHIAYKLNVNFNGISDDRYFNFFHTQCINRADDSFLNVSISASDRLTIEDDGTVLWYCNNLITPAIASGYISGASRGYTWVVKPGYVFGYRYFQNTAENMANIGFIADIISIKDYVGNKYAFVPLIINPYKGEYRGKVIDAFKNFYEGYKPKAYSITKGYIAYEKQANGAIRIYNTDTNSYSKVIRLIYSNLSVVDSRKTITWTEFTLPQNSVLVYNYQDGIISVKETLSTIILDYKPAPYEVILLTNNMGNIAGGDWMPYIKAYDHYLSTYAIKNTKQIGYDVITAQNRCNHDCTFIDGQLWTFDKYDDGGAFYVLDGENFTKLKNGGTNFVDSKGFKLEHKSVDYNPVNKVLAIGNGSSKSTEGNSHVYLFYDFQNWPDKGETVTFANCGKYVDVDVSDLGTKSYGFWAAVEDMMYISINRFEDIYLIQLGKGTNNLGSGTYTYTDDETFNGTYKVIKRWHQESYLVYGAHGGQYYDGNLYIADNHGGYCQIFRMLLNDDGTLQFENINLWKYTPDGTQLQNTDIDGLAIKDGHFYAQPLFNNMGVRNAILKAAIPR